MYERTALSKVGPLQKKSIHYQERWKKRGTERELL